MHLLRETWFRSGRQAPTKEVHFGRALKIHSSGWHLSYGGRRNSRGTCGSSTKATERLVSALLVLSLATEKTTTASSLGVMWSADSPSTATRNHTLKISKRTTLGGTNDSDLGRPLISWPFYRKLLTLADEVDPAVPRFSLPFPSSFTSISSSHIPFRRSVVLRHYVISIRNLFSAMFVRCGTSCGQGRGR